MANWDRAFSNGSYAANWCGRLVYNLISQEVGNNRSYVEFYLQAFATSGAYNQSGSWDARIYVNGNQYARSTPSASISKSPVTLTSWGGWLGHDANGNLYIEPGDYINAPVNEMTYSYIGWWLPRIAQAPYGIVISADQIKPTQARLGTEISSRGHGTSASTRIYYRIQGSGSGWSQTSDQGDVGGYNYWTVTGLKPGKTYEYFARWWNNNGDTADGSTGTFKTKSVPGMIPVLAGLMNG